MILNKQTVKYFLSQANLLDWHDKAKYTIKNQSGRNNNIIFFNADKSYFLKQSLTEGNIRQEGILQEVYFYSWLKRLNDNIGYKKNFIHFIGYEPKNKVIVFEFINNFQNLENKHFTYILLNKILSSLFCFHPIKWENEFPIIIKDKPDIWKIINEEPTTSQLPKQWFDVRNFIKTRPILLQSLNALIVHWNPEFICNADIKLDNFLIEKETGKIYWIDWERFCLADELWDIGGLLRLILLGHLKISKNLENILENSVFQKQLSHIWKKIHSINSKASKEKLILIWVASILEKTLELAQEESISTKTACFLIELCEEIQLKSDKIKNLLN